MTCKILIVYYSRGGNTQNMAKVIATGVEKVPGVEAVLRTVPSVNTETKEIKPDIPEKGDIYASLDDLEHCDGLIIGSPTRFGNMAAPLKHFIDSTSALWMKGSLINKPAAAFTSSSSLHGGQESTLLSMMLPLLHHGMVLAGVPYNNSALVQTQAGGTPYGPSHWAGLNNRPLDDQETEICIAQGTRVAQLAQRLKS